jgi:hypothetical protein
LLDAERLYDDTLIKPIDLRQLLKKIHALADIEWIYETRAAAGEGTTAAPPGASALPNSGDLDELIRLGEIGHVTGILAKLDEIDASAPECLAFTNKMRLFVNAFDFNRYASALQQVRGAHA